MSKYTDEIQKRREAKGKEHNNSSVYFEDYCPFGMMSASDFIHREALRACVCAGKGDIQGFLEHLVDVGVFADLAFDLFSSSEQAGAVLDSVCPYFRWSGKYEGGDSLIPVCATTWKPIADVWVESLCRGGFQEYGKCSSYRWVIGKKLKEQKK